MKKNTTENREKIAREFLRILVTWIAEEGSKQRLTKDFVQNANDHYDANMAMDEAFRNCGLSTFDNGEMSDDTMDLWNSAWSRAVELAEQFRAA